MGVAAEIVEDLLRSGERAFGIDDPFDIAEPRQVAGESRRFVQAGESAEERELATVECRLQALQEQAPVEARENADRKEEVGPAAGPSSIGRETAARHDAMDMRVMREGLPPGVQNGDHAAFGAEVAGIGTDEANGLRRRLEQDVVDDRLVLQG